MVTLKRFATRTNTHTHAQHTRHSHGFPKSNANCTGINGKHTINIKVEPPTQWRGHRKSRKITHKMCVCVSYCCSTGSLEFVLGLLTVNGGWADEQPQTLTYTLLISVRHIILFFGLAVNAFAYAPLMELFFCHDADEVMVLKVVVRILFAYVPVRTCVWFEWLCLRSA